MSYPQEQDLYRLLFESNPQSMWVYDLATLRFLAVNDAAVHHYGYSRAEFLRMTPKDIRPQEDVKLLENYIAAQSDEIVSPQTRPWHGPIPARVHALS